MDCYLDFGHDRTGKSARQLEDGLRYMVRPALMDVESVTRNWLPRQCSKVVKVG